MPDFAPVDPPFLLLGTLFGDPQMSSTFSARRTIQGWLDAERALAVAQAAAGVLAPAEAELIAAAAVLANIDQDRLWAEARNVGYPILPLIRMIAATLPPSAAGRVHYGSTTQDIMDTGLALQACDALDRLDALILALGDSVAQLVTTHRRTILAARTHAQQAVPTTLGAKFSVLLDQLVRHRSRIAQVRPRIAIVSLYGAGGTAAALGDAAPAIRREMAKQLGLGAPEVPWHVARDGVAELGQLCAALAATAARFAREVIDLSRTEIGELREMDGHHRGASSTMPQKANPINSEAIVGMAATAAALAPALYRAMEAGHERAAGEWQVEWQVLPQLACLAAGSLRAAAEVARELRVFPEAMRRNLESDGGLIMAEAYMMRLAPVLGREHAHDLVYQAASEARRRGTRLEEALLASARDGAITELAGGMPLPPEGYIGQAERICEVALGLWQQHDRRGQAGEPEEDA